MEVVLQIKLYGKPFTNCLVTDESAVLPKQYIDLIGVKETEDICAQNEVEILGNSRVLQLRTSALFLQPFFKCLNSYTFRTNLLINIYKKCKFDNSTVLLKLILEPPDQEIIDFAWNERLLVLIWTKAEIENAFSWLSTLGGAYSALGDYFEHCAEEAGRISIRQYKLSKMLGDEALAARSQLYSALAFAQKGYLKISRNIVRKINEFALETKDRRLNRMCQGVWTKLRYLRSLKLQAKCSGDHVNVNPIFK